MSYIVRETIPEVLETFRSFQLNALLRLNRDPNLDMLCMRKTPKDKLPYMFSIPAFHQVIGYILGKHHVDKLHIPELHIMKGNNFLWHPLEVPPLPHYIRTHSDFVKYYHENHATTLEMIYDFNLMSGLFKEGFNEIIRRLPTEESLFSNVVLGYVEVRDFNLDFILKDRTSQFWLDKSAIAHLRPSHFLVSGFCEDSKTTKKLDELLSLIYGIEPRERSIEVVQQYNPSNRDSLDSEDEKASKTYRELEQQLRSIIMTQSEDFYI